MSARMVIFVTADRPDPYLNVILYAAKMLAHRSFLLVAVDDSSQELGTQVATSLLANISSLVEDLRHGKYVRYPLNLMSQTNLTGAVDAEVFMEAIADADWDSLEIARRGVRESELTRFLQDEIDAGSSFDITACKNTLVAGISAALVTQGKSSLYTFELAKAPTFDAADLLPALKTSEYAYRRISDVPLVHESLRRVRRFSLSRRRFLVVSVALAVIFAFISVAFSTTVLFSVLTGFASFAGIASAVGVFTRD